MNYKKECSDSKLLLTWSDERADARFTYYSKRHQQRKAAHLLKMYANFGHVTMYTSNKQRGKYYYITPSTRPGERYQLTYLDHIGPIGHYAGDWAQIMEDLETYHPDAQPIK